MPPTAATIQSALESSSGNVRAAAVSLGISRRTLDRYINETGMRAWLSANYPRSVRQPRRKNSEPSAANSPNNYRVGAALTMAVDSAGMANSAEEELMAVRRLAKKGYSIAPLLSEKAESLDEEATEYSGAAYGFAFRAAELAYDLATSQAKSAKVGAPRIIRVCSCGGRTGIFFESESEAPIGGLFASKGEAARCADRMATSLHKVIKLWYAPHFRYYYLAAGEDREGHLTFWGLFGHRYRVEEI